MATNNIPTPPPSSVPAVAYAGGLAPEARAAYQAALADAAGIRLSETFFPTGTTLLPVGEEKKRALQTEIESLPPVEKGWQVLDVLRRGEEWKDISTPIQDVRMDRSGVIRSPSIQDALSGKGLALSRTGLAHIVGFLGAPQNTAGVLAVLPDDVRSQAFNALAERSARQEEIVLRTAMLPAQAPDGRMLRGRACLATCSRKYAAIHDAEVLAEGIREFPKGGRLRITRDTDRSSMEVIFPSMRREIRVGDAVYMFLELVNSGTKHAPIWVRAGVCRPLCRNFTLAVDSVGGEVAIRHIGELREKLLKALREAVARIEPLVKAFGDAYRKPLPAWAPTRGEVLERAGKVLSLPSRVLDRAGSLWDADGSASAGDTLAGLSNALTRASQDEGMEAAGVIERASGRLIVEGWELIE